MLTDLPLNQTACDREPIHIPGSIQPHGLMLIANDDNGEIVGGAGDVAGCFGAGWYSQSIDQLLQDNILNRMKSNSHSHQVILGKKGFNGKIYDILGHRSGPCILIEFDPAHEHPQTAEQLLSELDAFSLQFEAAPDTTSLFHTAARIYRQLTGFDRIMIYRFLEDGSGMVIAEDLNDVYPPFMNHHFPQSDIPAQARALYLRNRVRVIPDAAYLPAPLIWAHEVPDQPVDLSDVALRSVSPVHLHYLRNMGVAASASVSIIKDDKLWGLIACHNATPLRMPFATRVAASTLAISLSRQIKVKDEADGARERLRLRVYEDGLIEKLYRGGVIEDTLAEVSGKLQEMMLCQGFVVLSGETVLAHAGVTPDAAIIHEIVCRKQDEMQDGLYVSDQFGRCADLPKEVVAICSGIAIVKIWPDDDFYLIWFRAEQVQIVEWAGNPHKEEGQDPSVPLSPRASFAAWSEAVHGCSRPWNVNKTEAMHRLSRILRDTYQRQHIARLNHDLNTMLDQKNDLLEQKDYLLKEINHRVQNSLQLVSAFLMMQARQADNDIVEQHLNDAHSRIAAVALVHRRLYSDDHVGEIDLARYLEDLSSELFRSMGEEWEKLHSHSFDHVLMNADRAINLGLIFSELITNANKYAYNGAAGVLETSLSHDGDYARLIVSDRGRGKAIEKSGFGSKMLSAIVSGLGGTIEELDNAPGLKVVVTIPVHFKNDRKSA